MGAQSAPMNNAPPEPKYEFRGAWVTPIGGRELAEWPSRPGLPMNQQKAELVAMMDNVKAAGLNAVIFHVRIAGDALYRTSYAPWSVFLTGVSGQDPGYDPLEYAIELAHERGLQLHAWFNPFRAMLPNFRGRAAASHVTNTHPGWIRDYGSQTWIDPGEPGARGEVLGAILDVVKRYDVDGVHIDDYFYPYKEADPRSGRAMDFPDQTTWLKYGIGSRFGNSRDDWRRHNVDDFVATLYNLVKQEKPWVAVGISPFGIWRPGYPAGISGLDAYSQLYADSRKWLIEGWADYYSPQLYWPIGSAVPRFSQLNVWWQAPEQNPLGRHIWPGLATMHWGKPDWRDTEIASQIELIRSTHSIVGSVPGHVHFRLSFLTRNAGEASRVLNSNVYQDDALVPGYPWLSDSVPAAPRVDLAPSYMLHVPRHVAIAAGDTAEIRWWYIQTKKADGSWEATLQRAVAHTVNYLVVDNFNILAISVRAVNTSGLMSAPVIREWND